MYPSFLYRFIRVCLLCLWLQPVALAGQEKEPTFRRYPDPALSQTTISWITQDQTGFLWLATENGLYKYDGYSFLQYKSNPLNPRSLPHDLLFSLYTDKAGGIWSSSLNGFSRYHVDGDDFTRYYPEAVTAPGIKGNFIHRIAGDGAGNLWLATDNGVYTFHPGTKKFKHFPANPAFPASLTNRAVRSLLVDRQGTVWAGTEAGLNRIDPASRKVTRYLHDPGDPASLSHDIVRSLYEDRHGNIWVGTEGGLNKLDAATGSFRRYRHGAHVPGSLSSDTVLVTLEDNAGRLWVGTWKGLNIMEPGQEKFTPYFYDPSDPESISGNTVTALFADRTGTMWVGTNKGLTQVMADSKGFRRYFYNRTPTKSTDCSVNALLEDAGDQYWLGTANHLVYFNKSKDAYHYYPLPLTPRCKNISALEKSKDGTLWIGSGRGLFALRVGQQRITGLTNLISHDVWTMHADRTGLLWVGTVNGLYQYHPDTGALRHFAHHAGDSSSLSNNLVGVILEDSRGTLWIGTAQGGLNQLDRKTGRFRRYRHRPGDVSTLSSDTVTSLLEDKRGALWVGTGKGLSRFNRGKATFTRYLAGHPATQGIYGILEDNHRNLWISYRDGISQFAMGTGAIKDYKASDGLQRKFSIGDQLRNARGELMFAGTDGLTVFHPDSIRDAPSASLPPVVVTGFYLFNKLVNSGDALLPESITRTREITLSYEQFIFAFEFSALHFGHADKSQYAYKLEGFEKEWNYAGNRRYAAYSNVPPGHTYTFRVKAADDGGNWRTPETTIRVRIIPPFWQTPWFRAALAASLLGGVVLIYRVRERQHQHRQRELEEQVALRTVQISRQKEHIEQQAAEIDRINQLLRLDNRQLSENVKDLSQARVMQKRVTFAEFRQIYPDEEACLRFIAALKWKDGYSCSKCGNSSYAPGPVPYSRRCSRCSTIERATTGTLFCRVRFPITKGFYMLFLLSQGKPLTVDELSEILSHPRQTCWAFRKKVLEAMEAAGSNGRSQDGWSHLIQQA